MGVYKYNGCMYNQGIAGRARNDGGSLRVEPAMTGGMDKA